MTTSLPRNGYTPDRAAQAFADANRTFTGVLEVKSSAPAGKGGRLVKTKTTTFYCVLGAAKKTICRRLVVSAAAIRQETYRNGICPVCGRVYLSALIGWVFDRTGLSVEACPACLKAHALSPNCTKYLTPVPSPLAVFDPRRVDVTVDIRAIQAGYDVDWTVTWTAPPATPGPANEPVRLGSSAGPRGASSISLNPTPICA